MRRCAVAQHLNALDCQIGNGRQIGGLGTPAAEQGGAVIAFAIYQDQRLVGGKTAERCGADKGLAVRCRQTLDIERRQKLCQIAGKII